MIPNTNNVYGTIDADNGLAHVLAAMKRLGCWERSTIYRSEYDGEQTLRLTSPSAEFDSEPYKTSQHLVHGAVGGSIDDVLAFVRSMSEILRGDGIDHHFEVYDSEENLIAEIPADRARLKGAGESDVR